MPKCLDLNKYIINLKKCKQLFYRPIYSHFFIKMKVFKAYLKTNLVNSFIWLSKSLVKAFILFIRKLKDISSFWINY